MKININKKYKTRTGETVRILATDRKDSVCPVVGLVTDDTGEENLMSWTETGKMLETGDSRNDLIEVVPEVKLFIPIYDCGQSSYYSKWSAVTAVPFARTTLAGVMVKTIKNGVVQYSFELP